MKHCTQLPSIYGLSKAVNLRNSNVNGDSQGLEEGQKGKKLLVWGTEFQRGWGVCCTVMCMVGETLKAHGTAAKLNVTFCHKYIQFSTQKQNEDYKNTNSLLMK